ncbi:MAG: hypothetical protein ABSF22_16315 [Bryobacteraceae bacterium]|jgi:hypothetical protein
MRPEKAAWTANAWLKVLPLPAVSDPPQPAPIPQPSPIPAVTFVPTEELRAFMRKRTRRWMFHLG